MAVNFDRLCFKWYLKQCQWYIYPWAVYCDRPTQLYLKGRGEGGRGGGGGAKKVTTFQRLRPQEFSSGDSTGDFGLRSFRRPEIYCEGTAPSFIWRGGGGRGRGGEGQKNIKIINYCSIIALRIIFDRRKLLRSKSPVEFPDENSSDRCLWKVFLNFVCLQSG